MAKNYTKKQILEAIEKGRGFYNYTAMVLGCSEITAKKYIEKWDSTKEAFLASQAKFNTIALEKFEEALNCGKTWAVQRILNRIPSEGIADQQEEQGGGNNIVGVELIPFDD